MVTKNEVEKAMKVAINAMANARDKGSKFDKLAGKYFGIDDFSRIYADHDNIVDALQYGTANLTWKQLCDTVEEFKKEDEKSFWSKW